MEREGKTEGKKIEEEERQHTVRPSEEKNGRNSWDRLCKTGERSAQRGILDEKTPERQTGPETEQTHCFLFTAACIYSASQVTHLIMYQDSFYTTNIH